MSFIPQFPHVQRHILYKGVDNECPLGTRMLSPCGALSSSSRIWPGRQQLGQKKARPSWWMTVLWSDR